MLKQSLDGIEALYDQIEGYIEDCLHKNDENGTARSNFTNVKITNEHVCIPIHGLYCFDRGHQKEFQRRFHGIELPENVKGTGTYWVIMPRDYDDQTESASSGKRKKK